MLLTFFSRKTSRDVTRKCVNKGLLRLCLRLGNFYSVNWEILKKYFLFSQLMSANVWFVRAQSGPAVIDVMMMLGRQSTMNRLQTALASLPQDRQPATQHLVDS